MQTIDPPEFDEPFAKAQAVAIVLAVPRATLAGWESRYSPSSFRLAQVAAGATRLYSMRNIAALALIRTAAMAGADLGDLVEQLLGEGADAMPSTHFWDFAERLYSEVAPSAELSPGWASEGMVPHLKLPETATALNLREGVWALGPRGGYSGASIALLSGYKVPTTTFALSDNLVNAWSRALAVRAGIRLEA
ncbi:MAG: hypothetical protein C0500_04790 [Sphingobium sp.]|nr:hypothetical protein [Sphingobium sp.]